MATKVRVSYVVELTDDVHAGLENHYGRKFTKREAAETLHFFCRGNGEGALDDLEYERGMAEEWKKAHEGGSND